MNQEELRALLIILKRWKENLDKFAYNSYIGKVEWEIVDIIKFVEEKIM